MLVAWETETYADIRGNTQDSRWTVNPLRAESPLIFLENREREPDLPGDRKGPQLCLQSRTHNQILKDLVWVE